MSGSLFAPVGAYVSMSRMQPLDDVLLRGLQGLDHTDISVIKASLTKL